MQREICVHEGGLYTVLRVLEDGDVLLLHCAPHPYEEADVTPHALRQYRLVEVQAMGEDQNDHHGNKHTGCNPEMCIRDSPWTIPLWPQRYRTRKRRWRPASC